MKNTHRENIPHLVVDCRMINASGIGTYLKNILPGVIASGEFELTILGYRHEITEFEWYHEVTFIEMKSRILSIQEQIELPIKIPACEIYWSPNINGALFYTRAKIRVTTIHDVFPLAHKKFYSKSKLLFYKALVYASVKSSKAIITVSNFSKKEIIKHTHCAAEKINVIPLAVAEDYDRNYEFKKISTPYILFVGNVKPHKNLQLALTAFKRLNLSAYKFYVVGKKEGFVTGHSKIAKMILGLEDKVVFTGLVSDNELKNYYANAKLFVFPSLYEGFGLPVLEAMKFNIPILASNVASIPEVGGDAIKYFDPGDIEDLKKKITDILGTHNINYSKPYGTQLVKFNWKTTVLEHLNIFKRLVYTSNSNLILLIAVSGLILNCLI